MPDTYEARCVAFTEALSQLCQAHGLAQIIEEQEGQELPVLLLLDLEPAANRPEGMDFVGYRLAPTSTAELGLMSGRALDHGAGVTLGVVWPLLLDFRAMMLAVCRQRRHDERRQDTRLVQDHSRVVRGGHG